MTISLLDEKNVDNISNIDENEKRILKFIRRKISESLNEEKQENQKLNETIEMKDNEIQKLHEKLRISTAHAHDFIKFLSSNPEDVVKEYFENQGYKVQRGVSKVGKEAGVPDFYISNHHNGFFLEVKKETDGLRPSQIEWFMNCKIPIKIAIVKKNRIDILNFYKFNTIMEKKEV